MKQEKNMKGKRRLTRQQREAASIFGSMGGQAFFRNVGPEGMSERGSKGAEVRWKGHIKKVKN